MAQIVSTTGYLIHKSSFQNTSLILHFFSQDRGRFAVLAKGIKSNKKLNQLLNPFDLLKIDHKKSLSLSPLISIEALNVWHGNNILHKTIGLYFNELIYKALIESEPCVELFSVYAKSLKQLAEEDSVSSYFLRRFELELLKATGFDLTIDPTWNESDGLKIDDNLGLLRVSHQQAICQVIDLQCLLSVDLEKEQVPDSIQKASKLVYQAINLAVQHKKINGRDLIRGLWKGSQNKS